MGWWDEGMKVYPSMEDDDWYLRAVAVLGYSPYTGIPVHRQHQISNELLQILNKLLRLPESPEHQGEPNLPRFPRVGEQCSP